MKKIIIFLISIFIVCNICITDADSWGNTGWSSGNNKEYIRYLPYVNNLNDSLGVIWFSLSDSNFYYVNKTGVHIIGSGSGVKSDSAIYADSAFHLFADSTYVVDSINTRTAVVTDTFIVGDRKVYDNGAYIYINSLQTNLVYSVVGSFVNMQAQLYKNKLKPFQIQCYNGIASDSFIFLLTGKVLTDTVVDIDSLNNVRIRNNLIVDDTLKANYANIDTLIVNDTLTYYNSNLILFSLMSQDSMLTITQDAWTPFKFEKQALNTNTDYFLFAPGNDSTKAVIKKAGYYKFEAKYAYVNNTGSSVSDLLIAGRLTINSKELLCSQTLRKSEMKDATSRVLATSGFFNANVDDTIRLEYYSSDPNIDFHIDGVFDSLFAVGVSLEYMK